jgi:uncharacterized protein YkwD
MPITTTAHRVPIVSALAAIALLAMAAFAAFVTTGAGRAQALTDCSLTAGGDPSINEVELEFLRLINEYRADNGVGPLSLSPTLSHAATWKAIDMGTKNYFTHDDASGRTLATRLTDCDYPSGGWAGENLAAGNPFASAQAALDAWKRSPSHNENMLRPEFTLIGIAREQVEGSYYGHYWVTDFGQLADPKGIIDPSSLQVANPGAAEYIAGLPAGQHLVTWDYPDTATADLGAAADGRLAAIYSWNPWTRTWRAWVSGAAARFNDLPVVEEGGVYWFVLR